MTTARATDAEYNATSSFDMSGAVGHRCTGAACVHRTCRAEAPGNDVRQWDAHERPPRPPGLPGTPPTAVLGSFHPPELRPRPSPYRVAQHKPIARGTGIPFIGRAVLALGVVALGAVVLYSATGQIGKIMGGVGGAVSSFLSNAGANPSQAAASGAPAGAPTIVAPDEAYTSEPTVDITGTVPISVIGSTDYTISLYQALQGQQPTLVQQNVAIPQTATFTIPGSASGRARTCSPPRSWGRAARASRRAR